MAHALAFGAQYLKRNSSAMVLVMPAAATIAPACAEQPMPQASELLAFGRLVF